MNDFRSRLDAAIPRSSPPDVDELWSRGRQRANRRRAGIGIATLAALGISGLVVATVTSEGTDVRTGALASVDQPGVVDSESPLIDVPLGVELTAYPIGLVGWEISVTPQDESGETASLRNAATGERVFLVWHELAGTGDGKPNLEWGDSTWEVDLGFADEIETTDGWSGPDHGGSISVFGPTDPQQIATELFASSWFADPLAAPPTGWVADFDTRLMTGGGIIRATTPDGEHTVRMSTLIFADPPSAAEFSDFEPWAPPATTVAVTTTTGYQWNELTVWSDQRAIHAIDYWAESPPEPLTQFLEALQPIESNPVLAVDDTPGLGVATTTTVRSPNPALGGPTQADHWHAAYAIVDCGELLPIYENESDPDGIHTHGDGLIHIHPFNSSTTGTNATFGRFAEILGLAFDPPRDFPALIEFWDQSDCDGQPSETRLLRWRADRYDEEPEEFLGDARLSAFFEANREAWMVAHVAVTTDNADIDFPQSRIDQLDLTTGNAQTDD